MFIFYILVGLGIGGISGLLGIGGGVVLVPVLMWLFGYEQRQAQGITLAVLVVPVLLPAVWHYYQRGYLRPPDLATAGWIALGVMAGGFASSYFIHKFPEDTLRLLFGLALIYIGIRFLLRSDPEAAKAGFALSAVALAWLGYFGLKLLGHRHLVPPDLGEKIRAQTDSPPADSDYYI